MTIEQRAIEITKLICSPLYDDKKVYDANQDTFQQIMLEIGAVELAKYTLRKEIEARIDEHQRTWKDTQRIQELKEELKRLE